MPHIISGTTTADKKDIHSVEYDYEYPQNLDLRPGSKIHDALRDEVLFRAQQSHDVVSARFSSWNEIDRVLTTYIPADEEERQVQANDPRKPISIVFPYSYAIMETLLTYLMNAFIQDPLFRYEGVSPDDTLGAIMLEKVIQKQVMKTKVPLAMHTWFRDSLAYGVGYTAPSWSVRWGTRKISRSSGMFDSLGRLIGREPEEETKTGILFEGNALNNIDPYLSLPDPNVSVSRIQEGEFFGWIEESSLVNQLENEVNDQDYFNVRYCKHLMNGKTSICSTDEHDRELTTTGDGDLGENISSELDVVHMYINLIPADWELGDSEYPEKWMFSVAGDEIIIRAKPLGLNHGMYPVAAASPDFDGYSALPMSRLESLYGLQHVVDWLFNSHIANVRKAINDMLVVDPYLININDLKSPEPGKLIRMRRPAWGRGVKDAVVQLGVNDITRQNIEDTSYIVNWMNHVAGADESMMGSMRMGGPERLTAQEFSGTRGSAVSRLERMAYSIGVMGMQDIGYMFASHAQQLMSEETYINIAGEWEETLRKEYGIKGRNDKMKIRPSDLNIDYDVTVRDGSVPGSNMSQAWLNMFETIAKTPELQKDFSVKRIFRHIARGLGAKNVDEFTRKPEQPQEQQQAQVGVMGDENIQREVEKGNLVPRR